MGDPEGEMQGKECPWCRKAKELIEHHYPIPKNLGGIETIFVCRSCHQEDHNKYPDELIQRLIDEIEGRRMPERNLFGEEPHSERKKLIEEAMKHIEEEKKKQLTWEIEE